MGLKTIIKKLLNEWISPGSKRFITDTYFNPTITWYLSPHAMDRMVDDRNIEDVSEETIFDVCQKATPEIYRYFSDKRNSFKGGPGFQFVILDKYDYYLSIGCLVERHETLYNIDISIKTVSRTGSVLKKRGFVEPHEGVQLTIEV
jgi:hypothetical protein